MMPVLEAVPNFSEGRDEQVVREIVSAISSCGVEVLDWSMDPDHHRSVVTFVGTPAEVEAAAMAGAKAAVDLIDLRIHHGVHPRVGALDVLPFVPLSGCDLDQAVEVARRVASRITDELSVPTFLYAAASEPRGRALVDIGRGGFEGLLDGFSTARQPDFARPEGDGSILPHPTAGVSCVGARPLLLAWNVEIQGVSLDHLRAVASRLREAGGGFRGLRMLAFELETRGVSQLSMNLEDLESTSPFAVFTAIEAEITSLGGTIHGTEVIGMVPDALVFPAAENRLGLVSSSPGRLLSSRLVSHVSARAARIAEGLLRQIESVDGRVPAESLPALRRLLADLGSGQPPGTRL